MTLTAHSRDYPPVTAPGLSITDLSILTQQTVTWLSLAVRLEMYQFQILHAITKTDDDRSK